MVSRPIVQAAAVAAVVVKSACQQQSLCAVHPSNMFDVHASRQTRQPSVRNGPLDVTLVAAAPLPLEHVFFMALLLRAKQATV